jgi:glutamyl-tRNA(Gln) amidotransferase subunit E
MQMYDVTDMFSGEEMDFAVRARERGWRVAAVKVTGVRGLAEFPTQPSTTFLDELSGRIRVIACLDEPPIVLGSAQMPSLRNGRRLAEKVGRRIQAGDRDDFFIVSGPEEDCRTAADEIRIRLGDATEGVPKETRQSLAGGFTTFERILPGADRMYPDTDSPPTRVTEERVAECRARLGKAPWERLERYTHWRVPVETTAYLIRRGAAEIVDAVVEKTGADGLVAAVEIGQVAKSLKRAGAPIDKLTTDQWVDIFDLHTDGRLPRECIREVAGAMAVTGGMKAADACQALGIDLKNEAEWKPIAGNLGMDGYIAGKDDSRQKRLRFLAGKAMEKLKRKAPAKDVAAFLQAQLQEVSR